MLARIRSKGIVNELELEGGTSCAFPAPKRMAASSIKEIRECGLSFMKAEYIRDISFMLDSRGLDLERLAASRPHKRQ